MDIRVVTGNVTQIQSQALVLSYFEASKEAEGNTSAADKALGGLISQLITQGEIKGKFKEITTIYTAGKLPTPKICILGLGKKSELTSEKLRVAVAEVCRILKQKNTEDISISVDNLDVSGLSPQVFGQAIAEGAMLGTYQFKKYMSQGKENKEIRNINILVSNSNLVAQMEQGCRKGTIIAEATNFARDLGNEPANVITPTAMADAADQIARKHNLGIQVLDREEIKALNMGGLLGVAQGSRQPPKFIVLKYKGKDTDEVDIALVGKGITFDSGGVSIKPSENMGEMKGDMAGGAAVMGAISVIAQLKPAINVTAIIPATENMPSGEAFRPGDIITIMNGKTVEIISTDAEGRLILADALSYAIKLGAKRLVDVATLTGACHIALGDVCTGTFGNDQEFIEKIITAGKEAGECLWQMPMNDEYRELNKSDVADIKNTGGRYGGAISAAWFLREFVESVPWIHLDIAGTSTMDKDRGCLVKGNTGIPLRTLVNLVLDLANK